MSATTSFRVLAALAFLAAGCSAPDLTLEYATTADAVEARPEVLGAVGDVLDVAGARSDDLDVRVSGSELHVRLGTEVPGARAVVRDVLEGAVSATDADGLEVALTVTEDDPEVLELLGLEAGDHVPFRVSAEPADVGVFSQTREVGQMTYVDWTCGLRVRLDGPPPSLGYHYDFGSGTTDDGEPTIGSTLSAIELTAAHRMTTGPDTTLVDRVSYDLGSLFLEFASGGDSEPTGPMSMSLRMRGPPETLGPACVEGLRAEARRAGRLMLPRSRSALLAVRARP